MVTLFLISVFKYINYIIFVITIDVSRSISNNEFNKIMPQKIQKIANNVEKQSNSPVIILAKPQLGNNIGATARVMANFGVYKLRVVNPRSGWLNSETYSSSSGASAIIDNAGIFDEVKDSITDLDIVYATTARRRDLIKEVLSPRSAAHDMRENIKQGKRIGILFGGEKSGLSNEELTYADKIITAPVNPEFASLNLAQAVCVTVYEYYFSGDVKALGRVTESDRGRLEGLAKDKTKNANKEEYIHFLEFLEKTLTDKGFFSAPEKKSIMLNNIRSMFQRQNLTQKDIKILFGIFKQILNK